MASVTVLIEKDPTRGYRARVVRPVKLEAFGATEDEAIKHIQEQWQAAMKEGEPFPTYRKLRLPNFDRNDPVIQEWLRLIAENRARKDQEDASSDAA